MKRLLTFVLVITFLFFNCGEEENNDMPDYYAEVIKVADGDTFYIDFYTEEKMGIRIFGIDTPETVDKRKEVQYWGPEASEFSKQYLYPGIQVRLNFDGEITGPFGRLLAEPWILINGEWLNYSQVLLMTGNAFVYPKYPIPVYKLHEYMEYQQYAKLNSLGMWANPELIENEVYLTLDEIYEAYSWYRKAIDQ